MTGGLPITLQLPTGRHRVQKKKPQSFEDLVLPEEAYAVVGVDLEFEANKGRAAARAARRVAQTYFDEGRVAVRGNTLTNGNYSLAVVITGGDLLTNIPPNAGDAGTDLTSAARPYTDGQLPELLEAKAQTLATQLEARLGNIPGVKAAKGKFNRPEYDGAKPQDANMRTLYLDAKDAA